jgi:hypothetical protein
MSKKVATDCDECGKRNIKIHRKEDGHRYCASCYARIFKTRACPKCHELKRLPITNTKAMCTACKKSRPCVRCGALSYQIGLMTGYGPACNACSRYFRMKEPCQGCGRLSSELSKINRLGGQLRLCRACQRSDYGTCSRCRRHRLLITRDNENLCNHCADAGEIPCAICGQLMPGGRISRCDNCYWNESAVKKISINMHSFSSPRMSALFNDFGNWLILECGAKNAALSLHRYLAFFVDVERIWGRFPNYEILVNHFKAEGLRRVRRPMRWLSETKEMKVDCEVRENTSDEDRIVKALATFSADVIGAKAIIGYEQRLRSRFHEGKTSVKSIRLALTPALHLLQSADRAGNVLPDQQTLDRYLLETPGQKAAATGFINYLNEHFSLALKMKVNQAATDKLRRKKLGAILSRIVVTNGLTLDNFDEWVVSALDYFHSVKIPSKAINNVRASVQRSGSSGITVVFNSMIYYLPIYAMTSDTVMPRFQ